MIPPVAEDDDPTSQIPWPQAAKGRRESDSSQDDDVERVPAAANDDRNNGSKKRGSSPRRQLSTWDLITLSISMGGAQIAWTVELGYVFHSMCLGWF